LLWVSCGGEDIVAPETGDLVVRTVTEAPLAGLEGFTVSVDGGEAQAIGVNATITVAGLQAGDHSIALAGIPQGCILTGDNPRSAKVPAGGRTEVDFDVVCELPVGAVTVTSATSGLVQDPDGYTVQVDGGIDLPIPTNGSLILSGLSPGSHSLLLAGIAPNCTVGGENPRAIETVPGQPLAVAFDVACVVGTLSFTAMTSGTNADLPEVWGAAANDVFAVGEFETQGGASVGSLVLHFDGTEWKSQYRQDDLRLRSVWGSSATNVLAVGFHFLAPGAAVLRYDGTQWTQTQNFVSLSEDLALMGVWGSSASDVFAVGVAFDGRFSQSLIVHYDGTGWRRMDPPAETAPRLNDVWGSAANDVYAVGREEVRDPPQAVILHYDGTAWAPVLEEENLLLNAVWGSSATDVYAVGFEVDEDFNVTGSVRHFDGSSWTRVDVPADGVLQDVWGSSPTDVYIVGDDGLLLHYDGTGWTPSHPTRRTLLGVWGSSAADVFLVGDRGTIEHGAP
jgi:hypothetical protein